MSKHGQTENRKKTLSIMVLFTRFFPATLLGFVPSDGFVEEYADYSETIAFWLSSSIFSGASRITRWRKKKSATR
ncbi:MAG: hypothetical protein ACR2PY_02415 [Salinispira sp.]